jgi:cytochrome c oxidase subunit 3
MDLTQGTDQEKLARAKKMMLWFGIVSLIMSFAGWTSAFIVSSTRKDWLSDFVLPQPFIISVFVIIASSITLIISKKALKENKLQMATIFLVITFLLGIYFIINQFNGFNEIVSQGYHFTGPTSNVTMSYIFLIAFVHVLHVVVGLICLFVVLINQLRNKYSAQNMLGFELAATFWHFVDVLWVYLFFFLYFFK